MKLLLPLFATTVFLSACTSPDAPRRQLWADSTTGYADDYAGDGASHKTRTARRDLWGPEMPIGYSDPNATRRPLYSDARAYGPYTNAFRDGSWRTMSKPVDEELHQRREEQRMQKMLEKTPAAPAPAPAGT